VGLQLYQCISPHSFPKILAILHMFKTEGGTG